MKNKKYIIMIISILFLIIPTVNAGLLNNGDLILSLNQKDYYFKVGETAVVNLNADNSYNETISGLLSYTITQSVNNGNFQYSSSNTKSTSFSVDNGKNTIPLSIGTSDTQVTLLVNMKFSYDAGKAKEVVLNDIKIHFVNDDSQKNNQQNQVSSSSQEAQTSQQQQDPFAKQEQRMQQMMNQMRQSSSQRTQNPQQALENNQMPQDSSALRQQMQKQIQEQQQMKKEFQKQMAQNPEFQQEHQKLLDKDYNLTSANINPISNNTGDFELSYEKPNGEQASLKGQMQNGKIQNLQEDSAEKRQQKMEQLQQDKRFQKYQKQLQKQGFKPKNTDISQTINKTNIKIDYANQKNETATINAEIINNSVKKVELTNNVEKKNNDYYRYLQILLILIILIILGYYIYRKFNKKPQPEENPERKKTDRPIDYKSKALSMLEKSKELFNEKEYKNAYGTAGQALRLFLSYENKLNKETTNDEIIDYLRNHKKRFKSAKECFDLCSLVEFARYKANKNDFDKIVDHAKKLIKNQNI